MSLIVPSSGSTNLRYAQKYADEAKAKAEKPANRGSLEQNFVALGECQTPEEQKQLIFAMLGDYLTNPDPDKRLELSNNTVMVATYVRPQKSAGGIIFTDKRRDGNRFEGKVGLIVALGPSAFKYDGSWPWEGKKWEIGDWVWYRASDAGEVGFRDVWCRIIEDHLIKGKPPSPQDIY